MSSEIEINDTVVLGSNQGAWWGHQVGKLFAGRLSPLRCYAEGVGAKEIVEVPLMGNGHEFADFKGLVAMPQDASKRPEPLSVVGEGYGVIQDSEFFKILEQVYQGKAVVETAGTLRNGRRIWCLVARDEWDITTGDKVKAYDLWVNRHDGSGCFELHLTNVRVVCGNTWRAAIGKGRDRVFGVRHTRNVMHLVQDAITVYTKARALEMDERTKVRKMATVTMDTTQASGFFNTLLQIKDDQKPSTRILNQKDALMELFSSGSGNRGQTRLDGFNAVTEFVDYNRTIRVTGNRSANEARFESNILGTGDDMKARAFELLTA